MNYIKIDKCSVSNGVGLRTVLWVSGCKHYCFNCQNPQTWNIDSGILFDTKACDELCENLKKPYISGITYSGGDPLHPQNVSDITLLSKYISENYPNKTQWLYTGYVWNEIKELEIIKYLDIVVDGKYVDDRRDITLPWRGSSNQRVIDVHKTSKYNKIVLYT
ncbi:MAG: anaerobic ribonucleoside-triphosphate reductase activating protein [Ruminococcus sp.]|nr:anaerobic ribonucleoside-triphosphate reductase activating protein [Ruminococcus sp.]